MGDSRSVAPIVCRSVGAAIRSLPRSCCGKIPCLLRKTTDCLTWVQGPRVLRIVAPVGPVGGPSGSSGLGRSGEVAVGSASAPWRAARASAPRVRCARRWLRAMVSPRLQCTAQAAPATAATAATAASKVSPFIGRRSALRGMLWVLVGSDGESGRAGGARAGRRPERGARIGNRPL